MTTDRETLHIIGSWMEEGRTRLPDHVLDAVLDQLPSHPQRRTLLGRPWRVPLVTSFAKAAFAAVAVVAVSVVGLRFLQPPTGGPASDLGIFEPVAGRIVYGSENSIAGIEDGIWGVDPSSPSAEPVQLTPEPGTPMGWSSDGTRLLIQKGRENLFILHADGSETQVTEQLAGFGEILGSSRPSGASISPDGSRVVFAGLTDPDAPSCHQGALFAVDADGGPAELLWESRAADDGGIVRDPTFSPDGAQIAFVDGYCDSNHSVWVMNADGTDAHQIVPSTVGPLGATHAYGLAWSPAGDRIALQVDDGIYTFAPDGSGFTRLIAADWSSEPYWSPDGSRIASTTRCTSEDANGNRRGCGLAIVGADGSDPQRLSYGIAGPWHPGTPSLDATGPTPTTTAPAAPTNTPSAVGTFEPVAGPIDCGSQTLIIGCSSDGTRLLVEKGAGDVFVIHADGSETLVTERLTGSDVVGSSRPTGATISPDGSRVVFAGKTIRGSSCHDGALFAMDADGGPAELIWMSQRDGIVRDPVFSPDGTQIAFADGYCDSDQSVWVMNADGSDPHRIVGPIGAGHAYGLAWSPAGDRLALALDGEIYAFATDGSGFAPATDASEFCWPGRRC